MLCLAFQIDDDRYALDVADIVEVLPLVNLRRPAPAQRGIAGVILYRGMPVPVIDLSELLMRRTAHRRLSTRLIVVRNKSIGDETQLIGLIAEGATKTLRCDERGAPLSGIAVDGASAGSVRVDQLGLFHRLDLTKLLLAVINDLPGAMSHAS